MPRASRAVIRDCVFYANGVGQAVAPAGEYAITRRGENEIAFDSADGEKHFILSIDAVVQHLCEGRLRLLGGDKLPAFPQAIERRRNRA